MNSLHQKGAVAKENTLRQVYLQIHFVGILCVTCLASFPGRSRTIFWSLCKRSKTGGGMAWERGYHLPCSILSGDIPMLSLTATSCFVFSGRGRCLSSEQSRSWPVWAGMYWTCTLPSANSSTYILEIQVLLIFLLSFWYGLFFPVCLGCVFSREFPLRQQM